MTSHNRKEQETTAAREKFPEPRGWALQWDGSFHGTASQEAEAIKEEAPSRRSDKSLNPFPEPRGWAAKWSGHVLTK
jgi:hypothetical protein